MMTTWRMVAGGLASLWSAAAELLGGKGGFKILKVAGWELA